MSLDSIPLSIPHDQAFPAFYRDQIRRRRTEYYHAASLNAITLRGSSFWLYAGVAILANFGTRIADMKYKARVMRGSRTRRQIQRNLAGLVSRGYLRKHSPMHYSLTGRVERRENARLRPINPGILHAATNPDTALYARFLMAIAASGRKWERYTWRYVQELLHCDTGTAQALYRGFEVVRAMGKGGTLQAARRAVFWSQRPEWYRYREHGGGRVLMDPRPGGAGLLQGGRSGNVPPGDRPLMGIVGGVLTSSATGGGAELGGKPPDKRRRRCDQRLAALVLSRARSKRRRGRLTAIDSGDVAASKATAPACAGPMENETIPAGSVFESLIAGLPPSVRDRFETEPATMAERARRRIKQGYRA